MVMNRPGEQPAELRQFVEERLRAAQLSFQRGDTDAAVATLLNQGIKVVPDSPLPYIELTEILMAAGRHEDALQVLPEMPPTTDRELMCEIEAVCHSALGDDSSAARAAEQALAIDGNRPRALVVLGTLAARQGELTRAETLFRQAIDIDPACGSGWLSLGMLLWGRGDQEEAWQAIRNAAVTDPLGGESISIFRELAARLDRSDDAAEVIGEASKIHPDSIALVRSHAEILGECGHGIEALDVCESFLPRFGTEDGILKLALSLRERIGVYDRLAAGGGESVSLCMIVRNEEKNLAACLASVKPAVHELIIVDTGSGDRTIEIATAFGARVFAFPWNGNFSDGRNHALKHAGGAWILSQDADEVVSAQDYDNIHQTLRSSSVEREAWSLVTRTYTTRVNTQGWIPNDGSYPSEERADGWYPSGKVRLFPNDARIRFSGEVHELVEPALRGAGFTIRKAPFVIHHYGELSEDREARSEKQRRYYELGRKKLEECPDDVIALTELAIQAGEMGLFGDALELWNRVLAKRPDMVEALFNQGYVLMGLKRYEDALLTSRRALELDPAHKEAAFNFGTCALYCGQPFVAISDVARVAGEQPGYAPIQALLTLLYLATQQMDLAGSCYRKVSAMNYDIADYLLRRAETVESLGLDSLAAQLRQGLTVLDN